MDCKARPGNEYHVATVVRAPPYCNAFALCYEFPIPWQDFLNHHEMILFGHNLCFGGLELVMGRHNCIAEAQTWIMHCHCGDKMSLQCMAAKIVIQKLLIEFIKGARVNKSDLWLRTFVNAYMPDEINYIGSVMYRQIHYLYFRVCFYNNVHQLCIDTLKACLNKDMGFIMKANLDDWMIIKCYTCAATGHNRALKCCATRIRKIIQRMVGIIKKLPVLTFLSECTSRVEEKKQEALRQALVYGRCRTIKTVW